MGMDYSEIFKILRSGNGSTNADGSTNPSPVSGIDASFIYTLLSNWYLIIAVPAMQVTYNVFKALSAKDINGQSILDKFQVIVQEALDTILQASTECPQKIADINKFFDCLGF